MFDNDLFNDGDKPTNTLDLIRAARNKKSSQPRQQNVAKQANFDDDEFDHHFKNMKQNKDEAPQQLFDLLGDGNAPEQNTNQDFGRRTQNARQRLAGRGQTRTSTATENQNMDNFLYSGNGNNNQQEEEDRSQQNSNPFDVYNNNGTSNTNFGSESTTSSRPGTSTSMNARAKLAQMQKQRLAQAKNQNTAEGTLESNQMLRGNRKSNIYENSTIDFGKSKHQDFFYDPTQKDMGQSNLPELQKTNHVISYKAEEISAFTGLKQSNFVEYEEPQLPTQQEAPKQNKRRDSSGSPSERSSPVKGEDRPQDLYSPLEEKKDDKELSDDEEEPTKEELKALEKQKKELNKQQDAEIGIARLPTDPEAVSKLLHINTNDISDMKAFLMSPCPRGYRMECTIKRDRSGISNKFYPKYHCYISNGPQYLMSAKKRAHNKTSNYIVSYNKNEVKKNSPYCLGKVRSNFLGTEFNIYDHGLNPNKSRDIEKLRANLGVVLYESNLLSAKGPRKMRVLLPEWEEGADEPYQFKPLSTREGILANFKCGKKNGVKEFFNKNPTWNEQLQAFVLNFNGRVEKPSVKNFQMIDEQNDKRIYLQFGRVTNDTFNMDFEWPLTPFQAFTICLSSFDYKIACE